MIESNIYDYFKINALVYELSGEMYNGIKYSLVSHVLFQSIHAQKREKKNHNMLLGIPPCNA